MQEVRRRQIKPPRRRLRWLLLALLLASAALGWWLLSRGGKLPQPAVRLDAQRPQMELLFSAELNELASFTVKPYKGDAYRIERKGDSFRLGDHPDAAIDQDTALHMAESLLHLTTLNSYGEIGDAGLRPEQIGLDAQAFQASVQLQDGRQFAFRIGSRILGELPQDYLMVEGQSLLYGVDTDIRYALDRSANSLRQLPNINFTPDLLDLFTVEGAAQRFALRRISERLWELEEPRLAPASKGSVESLLAKLKDMRFASFVADVDEDSLARFGLTKPRLHVAFHLAASRISSRYGQEKAQVEVDAQVILLEVGDEIPGIGFYCRYLDSIYQASDLSMGFLVKAQAESYVGPPFDVPLSLVSKLSFEVPDRTTEIMLSLVEQVLPNNELERDEQGHVLYQYQALHEGKEIAAEPIAALYGELMQLGGFRPVQSHSIQTDAEPVLRIRLQFGDQRQREISFYRHDALHAVMAVNGRITSLLEMANLKPLIERLSDDALYDAPAHT